MDTGDRKSRFLKYYQHFAAELLPMRHERGALHNFKELWHYWRHFAELSDEQLKHLLRIDDWGTFFEASLQMLA